MIDLASSPHVEGLIWKIAIIVVVVLVALAGTLGISVYNKIIQANNKADNAWQTTHVSFQQALISKPAETVKGYAKHESGHA